MLIRLKNSSQSYKKYSIVNKTKNNIKLLKFLYDENIINGYSFSKTDNNSLIVYLKYKNNTPLIRKINFISKIKQDVFCTAKVLSKQNLNEGLTIIATSKGYIQLTKALSSKIGGKLICQII